MEADPAAAPVAEAARPASRRRRPLSVPSAADVQAELRPLTRAQLQQLGAAAEVPWTTIDKIRRGETRDPGIETVRRFLPLVDAARRGKLPPASGTPAP